MPFDQRVKIRGASGPKLPSLPASAAPITIRNPSKKLLHFSLMGGQSDGKDD
jgi:hypothetical protein